MPRSGASLVPQPRKADEAARQHELAEREVLGAVDMECTKVWNLERKMASVEPRLPLGAEKGSLKEVERGVDPQDARHVLAPPVLTALGVQALNDAVALHD